MLKGIYCYNNNIRRKEIISEKNFIILKLNIVMDLTEFTHLYKSIKIL